MSREHSVSSCLSSRDFEIPRTGRHTSVRFRAEHRLSEFTVSVIRLPSINFI